MFDIEESEKLYKQLQLNKAQKLAERIMEYPFVKDSFLDDETIRVIFYEEVDLEGQDVFDLFFKGGAIRKVVSKDNTEEQTEDDYILVEPIGDF